MGDYSKYFNGEGELYNEKDIPPPEAQRKLKKLATEVLDEIREWAGPITVNSGYRSPKRNRQVGGASNSRHIIGDAADICTSKRTGLDLFLFAASMKDKSGDWLCGGIGLYWPENEHGKFIHVDQRPKKTGRVTFWYCNADGQYTDLPYIVKEKLRKLGHKV